MTNIIEIHISGPVASGKTATLLSVAALLGEHGYAVAIPDRQIRNAGEKPLQDSPVHARPAADTSVFVLTESCCPALQKEHEQEVKP